MAWAWSAWQEFEALVLSSLFCPRHHLLPQITSVLWFSSTMGIARVATSKTAGYCDQDSHISNCIKSDLSSCICQMLQGMVWLEERFWECWTCSTVWEGTRQPSGCSGPSPVKTLANPEGVAKLVCQLRICRSTTGTWGSTSVKALSRPWIREIYLVYEFRAMDSFCEWQRAAGHN